MDLYNGLFPHLPPESLFHFKDGQAQFFRKNSGFFRVFILAGFLPLLVLIDHDLSPKITRTSLKTLATFLFTQFALLIETYKCILITGQMPGPFFL